MNRALEVGYVKRAHGIAGTVAVRTFDLASTVLLEVKRVLLRTRAGAEREATIESASSTAKEILLRLTGVRGRVAAEQLVGSTVLAFRADLVEPAMGEYFQGDLVGLTAFTEAGEELGKVEEVMAAGPVPNLVIRGAGGEWLIPFVDQFVPTVALAERRLVVRPLEFAE